MQHCRNCRSTLGARVFPEFSTVSSCTSTRDSGARQTLVSLQQTNLCCKHLGLQNGILQLIMLQLILRHGAPSPRTSTVQRAHAVLTTTVLLESSVTR